MTSDDNGPYDDADDFLFNAILQAPAPDSQVFTFADYSQAMKHVKPEPEIKLFADDQAAADALARVGEIDRALLKVEERKARLTAKVQLKAETLATPLQDERKGLVEKLDAYCTTERRRLTQEYRQKTASFVSGECGWREGRGRVAIEPAAKKSVLEVLKKRLPDFVRTKVEIDVAAIGNALRKDPKAAVGKVSGILWEPPGEDFWVKPAGAELVERV